MLQMSKPPQFATLHHTSHTLYTDTHMKYLSDSLKTIDQTFLVVNILFVLLYKQKIVDGGRAVLNDEHGIRVPGFQRRLAKLRQRYNAARIVHENVQSVLEDVDFVRQVQIHSVCKRS